MDPIYHIKMVSVISKKIRKKLILFLKRYLMMITIEKEQLTN